MAEKQEDSQLLSISEAKELIKELGGYKKVSEEIGVSEGGLMSSISSAKIGKQTLKSISLLKENLKLKEEANKLKILKNIILDK